MPWYAMGLSIMATQASAITFISTTGQSYTDGMRFVQFYFGLPHRDGDPVRHGRSDFPSRQRLHRVRVSGAALRLEDALAGERDFSDPARAWRPGISLYAPAVVLSVILGWPDRVTTILMGVLIMTYISFGGIKAVTWADVQQMSLILVRAGAGAGAGRSIFCRTMFPFGDAVSLAGAAGRLNAVTLNFDWNDRYNMWSGLIGGMFLALAYFGCDQSQVQRYLTGKSMAQSRLSLLFNAVAKIPMQFFILFIGAMVFVFFIYRKAAAAVSAGGAEERSAGSLDSQPPSAVIRMRMRIGARPRIRLPDRPNRVGDPAARTASIERYRNAQQELDDCARRRRASGRKRVQRHEFHFSLVCHALSSRGRGRADCRGDFLRGHVVHFRRDQFALRGYRDRHLPAPHQAATPPTVIT